jgi:PEP-CTERM motif-containing protein
MKRLASVLAILFLVVAVADATPLTEVFPLPPSSDSSVLDVPYSVVVTDVAVRLNGISTYTVVEPQATYLIADTFQLTSPAGTTMQFPAPLLDMWTNVPGFVGEDSLGLWTLTMVATPAGASGPFEELDPPDNGIKILESWSLDINLIPEPATYALVGTALFGLLVFRRRFKADRQ